MKTGKVWFELLTDKQQKQFKVNLTECKFETKMSREYRTFSDFCFAAFVFSYTIEGEYYWKQIANKKI